MQSGIPQPAFFNIEFIFAWLSARVGNIFSIEFFHRLQLFASILVILGITVILYCLVRLYEIKQEDEKKRLKAPKPVSSPEPRALPHLPGAEPVVPVRNEMWENIRAKLLSDSPSDWRLGIIEADIYMDRSFDAKGFWGDTVGDKLKNLTPDKLPSVQIAWEAHKVRNRIAHDGAAFALTMPEARRTLSYYEIVFRDLGLIE